MDDERFNAVLQELFTSQTLIKAVLGSPLKGNEVSKVTLRPLLIKGELVYQSTEQQGAQAMHRNLSAQECLEWLKKHIYTYRQSFLYTKSADYQVLVNKKQKLTLLTKPASQSSLPLSHNRSKQYLLPEGKPIPFLVQLGLMSPTGTVIAKKYDKFRQINRFIEICDDVLAYLGTKQPVRIVDFGCGKAYLTFALYHYLKFIKHFKVDIIGLDLKAEVIQQCRHLAAQLGYTQDLHFQIGDINSYQTEKPVDMVISLHACDTATDAALEKAVRWQAKVILSVPCCQHELYNQVKNQSLEPLLKHGILKERFAALATDALRAQLLEVLDYQTQVIEFIDLEHTPKNLLIRAVKNTKTVEKADKWQAYLKMKGALQVDPSLERRFKQELNGLR